MYLFSLTIITVLDVIFSACVIAEIAQLGERQTEDLKVPGSNPRRTHMLNNPGSRHIFIFFFTTGTSWLRSFV